MCLYINFIVYFNCSPIPVAAASRLASIRLLGMRVRIHRAAWMSVMSVMCCQALVETSPTECGVSECDLETSHYETKAQWGWQAMKTNFTLPEKFQTTTLELHAITVYVILNTPKCFDITPV